MRIPLLTCTGAILLAAPSLANDELLFTPFDRELSLQGPASATALREVLPQEVQEVVPTAAAAYTSQAYKTLTTFNIQLGDHNGDGIYWDPSLYRRVDALTLPRREDGSLVPLNQRRLFFSPKASTATVVCAGSALRAGDVGRVLPGGCFEHFIMVEHIRRAFEIPATEIIDVDACAHYRGSAQVEGSVLLSLEDDVTSGVLGLIEDGAIIAIPDSAIAWMTSGYDGAMLVDDTMIGSGVMVLAEPEVNAMVTTSMVADSAGVQPMTITDTDGLEIDPEGGFFKTEQGGVEYPNLWFCGQRLTGASVLTTRGGGSIAVLNGVPLGSPVVTMGDQVGLFTPGGVRSLDGLSLPERACQFVSDTPTPVIGAPGPIEIEIGGGPAAAVTLLTVAFGSSLAGGIDLGFALPNDCYPELYWPPFTILALPTGPDGTAEWTAAVNAAALGALAGLNLRFQPLYNDGVWHLGGPTKVQF